MLNISVHKRGLEGDHSTKKKEGTNEQANVNHDEKENKNPPAKATHTTQASDGSK